MPESLDDIDLRSNFRSKDHNAAQLVKHQVNESLARMIQAPPMYLSAQQIEEFQNHLALLAFNMTDAKVVSTNLAIAARWFFHIREEDKHDLELQQVKNSGESEASIEEQTKATWFYQIAEKAYLLKITEESVQFYSRSLQDYFCTCYCLAQPLNLALIDRMTTFWAARIWPLWAELAEYDLTAQLISLLQQNLDSLNGSDPAVALGYIGDPRAVDPLINALKARPVDYWAAFALGKCNFGSLAIDPLINALKSEDCGVRLWAAFALGDIGDTRALPALEEVAITDLGVTSWGQEVKEVAEIAIKMIKDAKQNVDSTHT